jgi:hypothetical protein
MVYSDTSNSYEVKGFLAFFDVFTFANSSFMPRSLYAGRLRNFYTGEVIIHISDYPQDCCLPL